MAQETFEICLDGDGFRIIPVTEDQVTVQLLSGHGEPVEILGSRDVDIEEATPLFLTEQVPFEDDERSKLADSQAVTSLSLYLDYGGDWCEDILREVGESGQCWDYPVYCSDGISWTNQLIIGCLSVKLRNILLSAGEDSCLIVPQLTKLEFDTFSHFLCRKVATIPKEHMRALIKVGDLFEFPIKYISFDMNNNTIDYAAIFARQKEEFVEKITRQLALARHVSSLCWGEGDSQPWQFPILPPETATVEEAMEKIICIECGREFLTEDMLATHMGIVHSSATEENKENVRSFRCKSCDASFAYGVNLEKHVLLLHTTPSSQRRRRGRRGGSSSTTTISRISSTILPVETTLDIDRFHSAELEPGDVEIGEPSGETLVCKICHKVQKNNRSLVRHVEEHFGKSYRCNAPGCSSSFKERSKLLRHQEINNF